MKKFLKISMILVIGFIGGIIGTLVSPFLQSSTTNPSTTLSNQASISQVTYDNQTSTTEAVKKIQDAVVSVINYQKPTSQIQSIFGNSESQSDELEVAGEGSGVIYKKDNQSAYIVTNTHVIAGAVEVDIQLSSGEKVAAELVGSDTYSDIAVLKIKSDKVTTVAEFANSDSINVGEIAIAIGSPLGSIYANSVTQGIVSSLSRTVTSKAEDGQTVSTNAIQTDTAINPGNSGGPLINIQGQVIGITSSKITSISTTSRVAVEGMGFAIPSNDAVAIINQLEKTGKVIRPALGIQMVDVASLSTSQLERVGLQETNVKSGVLITSTQSGLPADGKLKRYDIITKIDDTPIETKSDLQSALYKNNIGDTIDVTIIRNGKEENISIKLTHSTEDLS
ncbi:S1C family serine protease [Streptococcus cameli]